MILNLDQQDGFKIGTDGLQMGIDLSDPAKIFYILSQGFYKNSRRAIVQEVSSNIYDSVVASGKNIFEYPGYVVLTEQSITFKDFGEGISEERMEKIMSKFFATTKAKDPNLIGVMGLGFKSIFGYSSQFTVISVHDNIKRTWLFSKDTSQIDIIKLSEEESSEENQTSFIVPIKDDARQWYNEIINTVPYFKGIIFDCQINHDNYYNHWNNSKTFNETKLIEGKSFYYRENSIRRFHICLDQVIYEIDTNDLGIHLSHFPFGLKFSVSEGIVPLPNRESLMMSEFAKTLIFKRLRECLEELHEYYKEDSLTLPEYFKDSSRLKFDISGHEVSLDKTQVNNLVKLVGAKSFIKFNPVFEDIPNLSNKNYFFKECLSYSGGIGKTRINPGKWYNDNDLSNRFIVKGLTPAQSKFLRENYEGFGVFKVSKQKFWGNTGFYQSLELRLIPRTKWRIIVEEWIKEQKKWISQCLEFPESEYQNWLKEQIRSKPTRRKLENEEIKFYRVEKKQRGVGLKLVPSVWKSSDFDKKRVYVYFEEIGSKTDWFYELLPYNVTPIVIDSKNLGKLKQFIKVFSPEKFESSKYFNRLVYRNWIANNIGCAVQIMNAATIEHNGILMSHYQEIKNLQIRGQRLPTFLNNYTLSPKHKITEQYLNDVSQKAKKLILETDYHQRNVIGKKFFVCQIKCKRLERELNNLKQNNNNKK